MILIRTDGNRDIALGHVQRCLSIADALKENGEQVKFVTASRECEPVIEKRGFEVIRLYTDYKDMESELPYLEKIIRDHQKPEKVLVLVDSYQVTVDYMKALKEIVPTAYIDDMGLPVYPVDILINYDIHAVNLSYEKWYEEAGIELPNKILTGCEFAPLRKEFSMNCDRDGTAESHVADPGSYPEKSGGKYPGNVPNIMITTGGGDSQRILEKLPDYLRDIEANFHIIVGPFVDEQEVEFLTKLSEKDGRYILYKNVKNMSGIMRRSDMAISSAGSTLYELCALGIPSVIFTFAENQRAMAKAFAGKTGMPYGGDIVLDGEASFIAIRDGLEKLLSDPNEMTRLSETMKRVSDGRGAQRIARALIAYGDKDEGTQGES